MGKSRDTGPSEYDRRLWSRVYAYMLAELNEFGLLPEHHEELKRRGLSDTDIVLGSYRSLAPERNEKVGAALFREFHHKIWDVPGIIRRPDRQPDLAVGHGLLIPMRDSEGWVKACQVRTGLKGAKYVWFTRGGHASSAVHFAQPPRAAGSWILTEGPLKANVAQALWDRHYPYGKPLSVTFVACGGVSSWGSLVKAYDAVPTEARPAEVVLAFDVEDKIGTKAAVIGLVGDMKRRKVPVFQYVWEGAKGIDDALLSGKALTKGEA